MPKTNDPIEESEEFASFEEDFEEEDEGQNGNGAARPRVEPNRYWRDSLKSETRTIEQLIEMLHDPLLPRAQSASTEREISRLIEDLIGTLRENAGDFAAIPAPVIVSTEHGETLVDGVASARALVRYCATDPTHEVPVRVHPGPLVQAVADVLDEDQRRGMRRSQSDLGAGLKNFIRITLDTNQPLPSANTMRKMFHLQKQVALRILAQVKELREAKTASADLEAAERSVRELTEQHTRQLKRGASRAVSRADENDEFEDEPADISVPSQLTVLSDLPEIDSDVDAVLEAVEQVREAIKRLISLREQRITALGHSNNLFAGLGTDTLKALQADVRQLATIINTEIRAVALFAEARNTLDTEIE